jgi:hypothetical protein
MHLKNKATQTLILLAALTTLSFYSCKKADLPQASSSSKTQPRSAGDGRNDLLGYGYDVTGEYANSSASRFQVINVDQLQLDQPVRIEWDLSKKQTGNLVAGENAKTFLVKKSLNVKGSNGLGLFKTTISSTFSSSDAFNSKYVYSSFDLVIQQKRVKMNAGLALLKRYLTSSFLTDIQNESPSYLVRTYGTHVLADITLGAKLQVMYRSETSSTNKEQAAEAGVDVNMDKIFTVKTGYNHTETETQSNYSQSLNYQTIGGDPAQRLIGSIPVGGSVPKVDISSWQATSTQQNAEMIDFNTSALIPLYDLIDDASKQAALKAYIDQYLIDNQVVLQETPGKIYAKLSLENQGWNQGSDDYYAIFYDFYIRLYKEDKVTPIRVNNMQVNYRWHSYSYDWPGHDRYYSPGIAHVPNGENHVLAASETYSTWERYPDGSTMTWYYNMELLPGTGYEVLP